MSIDTYPLYKKSKVDAAGRRIRKGVATSEDTEVFENWRASHIHILNTFQATLRRRTRGNKNIVVAQRLKRKNTILDKLIREPTMGLSTMHDIAGCRLIFKNIKQLNSFRADLHRAKFKHERKKTDNDAYNYIVSPKATGYRGIHDVYDYRGKDSSKWDLLTLEIQYRTVCQHAWATAVEIAGSVTGNHAKFNQGDESHKEFFRITSEIISRTCENMPSCYPHLSDEELLEKFHENEQKVHLLRTLRGIHIVAAHVLENMRNDHTKKNNIVLVFEAGGILKAHTFAEPARAVEMYFELEKASDKGDDIVLVRADSNESIRNAYRNYFSDAREFIRLVDAGVKQLGN